MTFLLFVLLPGCATLTILNPFISDDPWMSDDAIAALEADEDASEKLTQDLLDFSQFLKQKNWEEVGKGHTAATEISSFPRRADKASVASGSALVLNYRWTDGWQGGALDRGRVANAWQEFLAQFSTLEATRIRVLEVGFSQGHEKAEARVVFKVVAKDLNGRREWLQWPARVQALWQEGRWRISKLYFEETTSLVAARPLFTEVSAMAGIDLDLGAVKPDLEGSGAYQFFGGAVADIDGNGFLDIYMTSFKENFLYLNHGGTFHDVSEKLGIKFVHNPEPVGPLFVDIDNDGDQDLFIAVASRSEPWTPQKLFRNDSTTTNGETVLKFTDISQASGADVKLSGYSAVAGDVNGDGFMDLYITAYLRWDIDALPNRVYGADGPENMLLINQGDGTFVEDAKARGVACPYFSFSAQFADYDEDGDLDLIVSNDFNADRLYVNDGKGYFEDVTVAAGVDKPGMGMGVHFSDYDNDGDLDLHAVYMSNVGGQRVIDRVDFDAPGGGQKKREILSNLIMGNRLYANQLRQPGDAQSVRRLNPEGIATFNDVTQEAGPFEAEWAWGGGFIDFDNDGREDLYCSNGFYSGESMHDASAMVWRRGVAVATDDGVGTEITFGKTMAGVAAPVLMNGMSWSGYERDKLYLQVDGLRYQDISGISGLDDPGDGRVTLLADFDNDGDMDIFLANGQRRTHLLFRNNVGQDKGFVRVVLEGRAGGRDAFGAQVRVKTARGIMSHAKSGGESFISQYDPRPFFGLDGEAEAEWVEVTWLSGEKVRVEHVATGTTLRFVEGEQGATPVVEPVGRLGGTASAALR